MANEKETGGLPGSLPLDDPDADAVELPDPVAPGQLNEEMGTDPVPSENEGGAAATQQQGDPTAMKILGREPALWIAIITSAILLLGTLGFHWLSGDQAGLVVAAISAIGGAVTAYFVRPIAPAAFMAAVGAIVALASAYGLNLNPDTVAAINSFVITVLALLTRGQVSPISTALTHASLDPTPAAILAETGATDPVTDVG